MPSSSSSSSAAADKQRNDDGQLDTSTIPAFVSNVNFEGIKSTSGRLLTKQTRQLFTDVANFSQLVEQAVLVRDRLRALNLFKSVNYFIDIDKGRKGDRGAYDVTFVLEERRRLNLNLTTMMSLDNRPSVVLKGSLLNTLGAAELIETNIHCGTNWDVARHLTVTAPLEDAPSIKTSVGLLDVASELSWIRLMDHSTGVFFGVDWPTFAGQHSMRMECTWRELSPAAAAKNGGVPLSLRAECGHYLRGRFRHVFERDARDNPILPTRGWMTRVSQEFATGGGGFQQTHLAHEMEAQWSTPLLEDAENGSCISFQLSGALGIMRSLPGSGRISVVDRFFLGGPLHLRGFNLRQVGDRTEDGSCPTGAATYLQAGAHLYSTLPWIGGRSFFNHFRLHAFSTGGCLSRSESSWSDRWNLVGLLRREARLSAGLGVVCQLAGIARFEVNYCWLLLARAGDGLHPGLQFGIGLHYL